MVVVVVQQRECTNAPELDAKTVIVVNFLLQVFYHSKHFLKHSEVLMTCPILQMRRLRLQQIN